MLQNSEIFSVVNVLSEFKVANEKELQDTLMADDKWHICKCGFCQKEISLLNCRFLGGDPICQNGCK